MRRASPFMHCSVHSKQFESWMLAVGWWETNWQTVSLVWVIHYDFDGFWWFLYINPPLLVPLKAHGGTPGLSSQVAKLSSCIRDSRCKTLSRKACNPPRKRKDSAWSHHGSALHHSYRCNSRRCRFHPAPIRLGKHRHLLRAPLAMCHRSVRTCDTLLTPRSVDMGWHA